MFSYLRRSLHLLPELFSKCPENKLFQHLPFSALANCLVCLFRCWVVVGGGGLLFLFLFLGCFVLLSYNCKDRRINF